ncbi:hybrid sensor histidine kinase/response regulator transcription factor [Roseivirga pacifica]|uniref:hybrid sensor histidine kinase/response regulator transcription factor n=1 Tax=Roseivirga pacifica TaxID=1267423 RepID=UPI00227A390D|nr:hybrid sensor histidine kinase/response regulator transcription factor [Roseivirga pacifica]
MSIARKTSPIFLLLLWAVSAISQTKQTYKFELIDVNQGLSHGQVNSIIKDSEGYMWFATSAGLNLYNGYGIKTFTYDPRDSSSINATEVLNIFEGPDKKLWVTTVAGLNIYDHATQSFTQNLKPYYRRYHLPDTTVEKILYTDGEVHWFVSTGAGLTRYNAANGMSEHFGTEGPHKLSSDDIADIDADRLGNLWVIHKNGLIERIDADLNVTTRFDQLAEKFSGLSQNYDITADGDGDLWVYLPHASDGVYYFDTSSGLFENYTTQGGRYQLNNNLVRGVVEAAEGQIWIGTDHGGINLINKRQQSVEYIVNELEVENSLVHNSVYHLYKDDEGIIWIGTYKNGINYYHESLKRFEHYRQVSADNHSLPFDDVNRFVEDKKGNLWIGTNGGGLLYFDRSKNSYKQYLADPNNPRSLSSNVIVSLFLTEDEELWVGTYLGGLDRFNGRDFEHYRNDPSNENTVSGDNIWEFFSDSQDNLWISTLNGGLDVWRPESQTFEHFRLNNEPSDSTLTINYIYEIEEDAAGNIWVAGGGGIDIVNLNSGKVLTNKPEALDVLTENTITSLYNDCKNRMWIGTQEGLYVYEEGVGIQLFTTNDGLPHNAILTLVEDNNHGLWLGTANGLSNMVLSDSTYVGSASFINYDETDGLQGKVFNENAALKLKSGELVFGGANGFNIFRPENLEPNLTVPKIVFTDFQLFNNSLKVGEKRNGRVILPSNVNDVEEVSLKHNENVFSIEFAALNFIHPLKNEYQYMLEGFDPDWISADQTRRVTYTNLDAGDYTFKVRASNNDGVWNEQGAALNIAVKPPFYATKWAYAAYTLLIVLALYITRRIMLARERMKYQIEQERREARQMHELDMLKIRFLTNISHEFRTPLSLILAPLDKLIKHTESNDQHKQFVMIKRNARRLLNLVNQLLDFRKLEVDSLELNKSEGNIIKFIDESVHSFADLSENKKVALTFSADRQELYTSFDMDKLEKVLFNLLSNAFKFTPEGGKVAVYVNCIDLEETTEHEKIVEIKVQDTGIGIPKDKQARIFERFFRNEMPGNVVNQGSGIGLSITREFVNIHGGSIEVASEVNEGSCFTVKIPVKEVVLSEATELDKQVQYEREFELQSVTPDDVVYGNDLPVILLVEDNEDFRYYLMDNLKAYFKVVGASNGLEGWQKCLSVLPDLVVSDLMMPELNGMEFCKKVKEDQRTSHIPFILLTADTTDDSKLTGIKTGADDYVTKPFNFEILHTRITNIINQHKSLQEAYSRKISVETSEVEITSLNDKLIQDAIKVVEEHMANTELSVEMLSKELGLSRAHLYKKLVALTGMTPVEFIRKIRIQRAAQLLKKSQLTVSEVAYKVGFNNRKYFTKYFKQEYNMLPSVFANIENN